MFSSTLHQHYKKTLIQRIVDVINEAYARGEAGCWINPNEPRTNLEEIEAMVEKDQILLAVAEHGDFMQPLGVVMVDVAFDLTRKWGYFSMLAVKDSVASKGFGRALLQAAEEKSKAYGCEKMRIEIFSPQDWIDPQKEALHAWYTRLGYVKGASECFSVQFPEDAKLLKCPCQFTEYIKQF